MHSTTNNNTNTSHNQQKSMSYYTTHTQQTHINLYGMKEKQYIQSTECLNYIYNKDIEIYHNFVKIHNTRESTNKNSEKIIKKIPSRLHSTRNEK